MPTTVCLSVCLSVCVHQNKHTLPFLPFAYPNPNIAITMSYFGDNSRRTFRGRGGPTDRRLPKHQARKRKGTKPNQTNQDESTTIEIDPQTLSTTQQQEEHDVEALEIVQQQPQVELSSSSKECALLPPPPPPPNPAEQEIRHLQRRIRNVQESIQLSSDSVANPAVWQENVLNAVHNCVQEWRSILLHHYQSLPPPARLDSDDDDDDEEEEEEEESDKDDQKDANHREAKDESTTTTTTTIEAAATTTNGNDDNDDDNVLRMQQEELVKKTSLAVFGLLQLAVQCGPLKGGKPGYFKRCGSAVAQTTLVFLETTIPPNNDVVASRFTPNQRHAIAKWKTAATKAIQANKEPSRTALQKQQPQQSKKKKNKQKKSKGGGQKKQ